MKLVKISASASVLGIVTAGLVVSPVFAWHPEGTIVKYVQDETTNSALSDANTVNDALDVNTGDTLNYIIKVSNVGSPASNGDNDMVNTVMTDSLPSGVELVSDPSQQQVQVNMGTITPGQVKTDTITVKVTSDTDGSVITNKACFTGNSEANDSPQSGCDTAVVKVHVPPTPTPTPTPAPTKPQQPTSLPNTGAGDVIVPAIAVGALGYIGYLLRLKAKRHTV